MVRKDPDWARDELILAMDLYVRAGRRQLDRTDPEVIALSKLLIRSSIHPPQTRTAKFRNPSGVSMKLGNFLRIDPAYKGSGLRHGGKLERQIWTEFADRSEELREAAEAITSQTA